MAEMNGRVCSGCGRHKPADAFSVVSGSASLRSHCKVCRVERSTRWRLQNRERHNAVKRASLARNPDSPRTWREANRWLVANLGREWRKANADKCAAASAERRARMAAARWADSDAIDSLYALARIASEHTGQVWHVDHIYPLKGKRVSGLHVEHNLQLLPAVENISKGNRCHE